MPPLGDTDEEMVQAGNDDSDSGNSVTPSDAERERYWERLLGSAAHNSAADVANQVNAMRSHAARTAAATRSHDDNRTGVREAARLQTNIESTRQPLAGQELPPTEQGSWLSGF